MKHIRARSYDLHMSLKKESPRPKSPGQHRFIEKQVIRDKIVNNINYMT